MSTRGSGDCANAPTFYDYFESIDTSGLSEASLVHEAKQAFRIEDYERALVCYLCALGKREPGSDPFTESLLLSNAAACRLQRFHQSPRSFRGPSHHGGNGDRSIEHDSDGASRDSSPPLDRPPPPPRRRCDDEGLVEAAIADARRCTQLNPLWAGGHLRLAQALIATGRRDASNDACTSLLTALELRPHLSEAKELLRRELRRDGAGGSDPPRAADESGGRNGDAAPSPRYELDESAVVTRRDCVELKCRRVKLFLRVNQMEIWIGFFGLIILYSLFTIFCHCVVPRIQAGVERVSSRCHRLVQDEIQLHLYRWQYEARKSQRGADAPSPLVLPESSPTSGQATCATDPMESMWSWVTTKPEEHNAQCEPAELMKKEYM